MHTQVEIRSHAAISSDGKSGSRKEMAQRGRNERRRRAVNNVIWSHLKEAKEQPENVSFSKIFGLPVGFCNANISYV